MHYISTRGHAARLDFESVLMAGLARDGGLYVPERWPQIGADTIRALAGQGYVEAANRIMTPLAGGKVAGDKLSAIVAEAYSGFAHQAVAPLVQLDSNLWLLELFHGPTLAFKDLAMQLLGLMMDRSLKASGERATILAATSGDTGAAAVEAFKNREAIDLFVLFPDGRISEIQRRQMTTSGAGNVHPIAVRGNFDDCQSIVKALFADLDFRDAARLSAVNSINWARIMAQTVYYFTAAASLGGPDRAVRFTVPTGNFGDIFAGYAAERMGLPVERLVIATNTNDILARTLETGRYEPRSVVPTSSPSMDIQVSSNFERLIFEVSGRDADRVERLMGEFSDSGSFALSEPELSAIRSMFSAYRADENEVSETMRRIYSRTGYLADPHTAVGIAAAEREAGNATSPMIVLSTAHPAKFPDAVKAAAGRTADVPERLRAILAGHESSITADADAGAIRDLIRERGRFSGIKGHG
ncbi:MAG TPA: threonine synthase [Hyphomicrobiales bacterium]|nr:threonine synthase [Hyphomicrobiales bacterium]